MKYNGEFPDRDSIVAEFGLKDSEVPPDSDILFADYHTPPYEGYAFVLFKKDGKLYEVNGSHCSCHGLSEESYSGGPTQWQPENKRGL